MQHSTRSAKKKQQGFANSDYYSKPEINIAKFGRISVFFLLLIPLYFIKIQITVYQNHKKSLDQICGENLKKTGLLITNFAQPKEDDGFSSTLYGKLNSDLQNIDTIQLKLLGKYILETSPNYLDTIKNTFEENCSKSGLIVYGNRKNMQFNCRIYSLNFLKFTSKAFNRTKDSTIIYIQNPNIINFTVEEEANVISEFLHGLLFYHAGAYELSNKAMHGALRLNTNPKNKQFISICHLFIGNSFVNQGQTSAAINSYKDGISVEPSNSYLHYNLAAIYNSSKDIAEAFKEYQIAAQLNHQLKNPLQKVTSPETSTSKVELKKTTIKDQQKKRDTLRVLYKAENTTLTTGDQHWFIISKNQKYGIINDKGDTISNCKFDEIDYMYFKKAHCFIGQIGKRYGAFMLRTHHNSGEKWHELPVEYSIFTIQEAIEYCLDHHYKEQ
ncbi:tetratricopeptide repeat protein [Mucilaginibacter sp. Mucisp84]|uniref:tetratricopeptide repeat protein n=1 Tax=Mucilaginibacter sp. Mucisp84 TaxID=3243058 RepID=UPI0039A4BC9B